MKHENSGNCQHCLEIFNRYTGFHYGLKQWFLAIQIKYPEAHISCAGRGKVDQEDCFDRKVSRAHYSESAHNYNAAIDIFKNEPGEQASWPEDWFKEVVGSNLPNWLEWYGSPTAKFRELPHVQVLGYKTKNLQLVEPL